jgi:hypothetical protein
MKIILYISTLVVLISCSTSSNEIEKKPDKIVPDQKAALVSDSNKVSITSSPHKKPLTYTDSVWKLSQELNFKCETSSTVTIEEEEWTHRIVENNLEVICISKVYENILHTEQYLLKNNELIYAVEWEKIPANVDDVDASFWNCEYIIKDKSVVDYISIGMGRTEGDSFNPEDIVSLWDSHSTTYKNIKNTNLPTTTIN